MKKMFSLLLCLMLLVACSSNSGGKVETKKCVFEFDMGEGIMMESNIIISYEDQSVTTVEESTSLKGELGDLSYLKATYEEIDVDAEKNGVIVTYEESDSLFKRTQVTDISKLSSEYLDDYIFGDNADDVIASIEQEGYTCN